MAGYNDTINAMKRDYKNGELRIARDGGKVTFEGSTYGCKHIIKGMGPRDGGARWNGAEKRWEIAVDDLFDGDLSLLAEITDGKLVEFAGYEDGKSTYSWK